MKTRSKKLFLYSLVLCLFAVLGFFGKGMIMTDTNEPILKTQSAPDGDRDDLTNQLIDSLEQEQVGDTTVCTQTAMTDLAEEKANLSIGENFNVSCSGVNVDEFQVTVEYGGNTVATSPALTAENNSATWSYLPTGTGEYTFTCSATGPYGSDTCESIVTGSENGMIMPDSTLNGAGAGTAGASITGLAGASFTTTLGTSGSGTGGGSSSTGTSSTSLATLGAALEAAGQCGAAVNCDGWVMHFAHPVDYDTPIKIYEGNVLVGEGFAPISGAPFTTIYGTWDIQPSPGATLEFKIYYGTLVGSGQYKTLTVTMPLDCDPDPDEDETICLDTALTTNVINLTAGENFEVTCSGVNVDEYQITVEENGVTVATSSALTAVNNAVTWTYTPTDAGEYTFTCNATGPYGDDVCEEEIGTAVKEMLTGCHGTVDCDGWTMHFDHPVGYDTPIELYDTTTGIKVGSGFQPASSAPTTTTVGNWIVQPTPGAEIEFHIYYGTTLGSGSYKTVTATMPASCDTPIDGECGTANGHTYSWDDPETYDPLTQCTSGNPSNTNFPSQGGNETWTCSGSGSGANDSPLCSADRDPAPNAPTCGTANTTYPNGTTSYGSDTFCVDGVANPLNPNFPSAGNSVDWTCSNGGGSVECTASQAGLQPIPGECGTIITPGVYYGQNLYLQPTSEFCVGGISQVNNLQGPIDGVYTWTCLGFNGGGHEACTIEENRCGDGVVQGNDGEECDDGGQLDGDGCSSSCTFEAPTCTGFSVTPEQGPIGVIATATIPTNSGFTYFNLNRGDGSSLYTVGNSEDHTYTTDGTFDISVEVRNNLPGATTYLSPIVCNDQIVIEPTPIDGLCGDAEMTYPYGTTGYGNKVFCAEGTVTPLNVPFPGAGLSVTWTCEGVNNGADTTCTASQAGPDPIDGVCGGANGKTYAVGETSYGNDSQCASGNSSNTAFPGFGQTVTWSCDGLNQGGSVTCSASRAQPVLTPGVCGSINGKTYYGQNVFNITNNTFCEGGVSSVINFTGPDAQGTYTWNCLSANGGPSSDQCSVDENRCGDGNDDGGVIFENGNGNEQCDDGNTNNNDACNTSCEDVIDVVDDVYDLALVKKINGSNTTFRQGNNVTFAIEVINQGTVSASGIELVDYIPSGLSLVDTGGWSQSGSKAYYTYNGTLLAGQRDTVYITFEITQSSGLIKNWAEISADNGDDRDSTPDSNNSDCFLDNDLISSDNYELGLGGAYMCDTINGDEDDHDRAEINVSQVVVDTYDLALTKKIAGSNTSFSLGDTVTFDIELFNQGTVSASGIELVDYIPSGLNLVQTGGWTQSGSNATYTYNGTIQAGQRDTVSITFEVTQNDGGTIRNWAEISSDNGNDADSTPDTNNTDCFIDAAALSSDNYVLGGTSSSCNSLEGDEDDHDRADININTPNEPTTRIFGGSASSIPDNQPAPTPEPTPAPVVQQPIVQPPVVVPPTPLIEDPRMFTYVDTIAAERDQTPGNHFFQAEPEYLQTGSSIEVGMQKYGIGVRADYRVNTTPPSWGQPHDNRNYPTDLNYWLNNVLLPYDSSAGNASMYVLAPEAGYLIPINELDENDPTRGKMIRGESVDIAAELQDDFATGIIHHAGSVKPGEYGKSVIAMHSSRWNDSAGRYIEGKYPTIGQMLAGLLPGDDIVYYVKNESGSYDSHTYRVNGVNKVDPSDINNIYPASGYEAMLYTCTDFGVSDQRLLVNMKYVSGDRSLAEFDITNKQREMIDSLFVILSNRYDTADEYENYLTRLWNKVVEFEEAGRIPLTLKEPVGYIKWHVSNTMKSLSNGQYDVFGN